MFYLYILYSENLNSYYVGVTAGIEQRLKRYLSNHKGYTSKTKDWIVVYSESFELKAKALSREKEIKNWKSKIMIQKLIGS